MAMAENQTNASGVVKDVPPDLLSDWLKSNDTVLVDVREDFEHAEERIAGAVSRPLSRFDPDRVRAEYAGKRIIFHCRSGKRSSDAARRFSVGGGPVMHLAGGIEGWKAAGLPVARPTKAGFPIMRQVQIVAGALVAAGVALGVTVSPLFLGLSAFVGCGLMFAGLTGWCGMAMLLARMPWNRGKLPAGATSCAVAPSTGA